MSAMENDGTQARIDRSLKQTDTDKLTTEQRAEGFERLQELDLELTPYDG